MAKRKRKTAKKAKLPKKAAHAAPARRPGRKPKPPVAAASGMSGAVSSLRAALQTLVAERSKLDTQIEAIQGALAAIGAPAPARVSVSSAAGGRRSGSLKDFIERVLGAAGDVMAVKDITDAVLNAGYQTKNRTLAKSVGIALTEMKNVEKVGRGKFRLK